MDYKEKWVIKAVFVDDNDEPKGYSYYDVQLFDTEAEALAWIGSDESDPVVESCHLDAGVEDDLKGLYFDSTDGLVPIQVKDLPYEYQPVA